MWNYTDKNIYEFAVFVLVLSWYFASHFSKIKWFNMLSKSIQTEIKYIKQIKQE